MNELLFSHRTQRGNIAPPSRSRLFGQFNDAASRRFAYVICNATAREIAKPSVTTETAAQSG